jgi:hypothetical protein
LVVGGLFTAEGTEAGALLAFGLSDVAVWAIIGRATPHKAKAVSADLRENNIQWIIQQDYSKIEVVMMHRIHTHLLVQ